MAEEIAPNSGSFPAQGRAVYSVSEITRLLKRYVEAEPLFRHVTVCGEISNFKHHSSGHMYFCLKDEQSTLRCVMFRSRNASLRFQPQQGLRVYATGSIGIYEVAGNYQLYVETLEPQGQGDLHLAFEQLKERLRQEGLFDPAHKRPLPFMPRRIGVVTSPTGAAVRDLISIMTRRLPGVDILISPALVQGQAAAASIVAAIRRLIRWGQVDLIIVGRGGGSLEDLWPFNEEIVARAVFDCPVPVISAVGHETDFTICDFVADLRAPTPSGAAELAVPLAGELKSRLQSMAERLNRTLQVRFQRERERLAGLSRMLNGYSPADIIRQRRQRLDELSQRLETEVKRQINTYRRELEMITERLGSLSPLNVLRRGYTIVRRPVDGRPVTSVVEAAKEKELDVLFKDGTARVQVIDVSNHQPEEA